jgi:hypothetical protein
MRAALSYLAAFFIVGIGATLIPTERLLHTLTDTDDLVSSARRSSLYEGAVAIVTQKIQRDFLQPLEGTPAQIDSGKVAACLQSAFPAEWFYHNLETLHRTMTTGETGSPVFIHLSDRKELLIEAVLARMVQNLNDLPECDPRMALSVLRKWRPATSSLRELIPNCRPLPAMEERLRSVLGQALRERIDFIPDTLDMNNALKPSEGNLVKAFREMRVFVSSFAVILYVFLLLLLGVVALINRNDRRLLLFRLGLPLLLTGLFIALAAFALNQLFDTHVAPQVNPEEVKIKMEDTTIAAGGAFGAVMLRFLTAWLGQYFTNLYVGALVFVLIGGFLVFVPRFLSPPEVPLRGS